MFFEGDGFSPHELTADDESSFLQKSSGAFPSQLSFNSNDPYRETSDAFRGVPLGQFGGWSGSLCKTSDPYADEDDVVRGCSIAQPSGPDFLFGKPTEDGVAGGFFGHFLPLDGRMHSKDGPYTSMSCPSTALEASASSLRFQLGSEPPAPPNSDHFHFEATTLHITVKDGTAHKVGNSILDFLDSQIVASVLKVGQKKYSIKVDWFLDHIMCTAKIRIWKVASKENQYAIEFQRRGGDAFAFAEGFRQCIDFLASQFPENAAELRMHNGEERKRSMPKPPPPPTEGPKLSEEELDAELFVLLDLAGMTEFPNLQGEAASALAKLACDDRCIATHLSKASNLDKLLPLLSSDSIDIIYPTARMLSAVAMTSQHSVAEHSISKAVITKIGDPNSNQLVRLELAKAVSNAVSSCPVFISATQAQELHQLLEFTMQDLYDVPAMQVVCSTLQDTLFQLKPYCNA